MRLPYQDPVDLIWLGTLRELGWRVERSDEVFASWDGQGLLRISSPAGFDPDDCLAQMCFHEVCHALVQGPENLSRPDFGMENIDDRDLVAEWGCHRLQAALLDPHGLRWVLAPTTDHRPYYEALPARPLAPCDDPALPLALAGYKRAMEGPWAEAIQAALQATAEIGRQARRYAPDSLWAQTLERHPTGLPPAPEPRPCTGCAWARDGQCLVAETAHPVAGCGYWEPRLGMEDCADCGACCRQGFDVVDLEPDSPLLESHTSWVEDHGFGPQLPRPGGFCVGLEDTQAPFRCSVYSRRPKACRDLAPGSEGCLAARERCGVARTELPRPRVQELG